MRTLTGIGIEKMGKRFVNSVDHAAYTLNGQPKTMIPFRKMVEGESAKVYIYFDDTVSGTIGNVQLIDTDGDIIAEAVERSFIKTANKGLYVAFKYNIRELEVDVNDEGI